ncbi:hypothetical protein D5086_033105 [Populus alba]|uniref:Uncharacterized protein n=1 Tax=Populus alba TaxID=43335 RepID=A0ACC4AFV4_POPAL
MSDREMITFKTEIRDSLLILEVNLPNCDFHPDACSKGWRHRLLFKGKRNKRVDVLEHSERCAAIVFFNRTSGMDLNSQSSQNPLSLFLEPPSMSPCLLAAPPLSKEGERFGLWSFRGSTSAMKTACGQSPIFVLRSGSDGLGG